MYIRRQSNAPETSEYARRTCLRGDEHRSYPKENPTSNLYYRWAHKTPFRILVIVRTFCIPQEGESSPCFVIYMSAGVITLHSNTVK